MDATATELLAVIFIGDPGIEPYGKARARATEVRSSWRR
jgi:hypothetical protein